MNGFPQRLAAFAACSAFATTHAAAQVILIDDFDDGDIAGWEPGCPSPKYGCTFDLSSGRLCMGTTGTVPENVFASVGLQWTASAQPAFSDGRLRATVFVSKTVVVTNAGLSLRWDPELGRGYVFIAAPGTGDLYILRINGASQQVLASIGGVSALLSHDCVLEAGADGPDLTFKVWAVGTPEPASPQLTFTDTSLNRYTTGYFGLGAAHPVPGPASRIEACFDDVSFAPACPADFDLDGTANSQDFFDFIAAFFALEQRADFNADGTITSQDFFDFLTAFFAGCP